MKKNIQALLTSLNNTFSQIHAVHVHTSSVPVSPIFELLVQEIFVLLSKRENEIKTFICRKLRSLGIEVMLFFVLVK